MEDRPLPGTIKERQAQLNKLGLNLPTHNTSPGDVKEPTPRRPPPPPRPRPDTTDNDSIYYIDAVSTPPPVGPRPVPNKKQHAVPPPLTPRGKQPTGDSLPTPQDEDRGIIVTGFDKNVTEEALKLHFENQKKSGGGPVDSVSIIDGTALVHFKLASDAQNVFRTKEQTLRGQRLLIDRFGSGENQGTSTFLVSGLNRNTDHEMLENFLESKIENCSVLECQDYETQGSVLVTFDDGHCPDLGKVQSVFKENRLNGSTLRGVQFDDTATRDFNISKGQMTFVERYYKEDFQQELEKLRIDLQLDKTEYKVILKGRRQFLGKAVTLVKDCIQETEFQFGMPGLVSFKDTAKAAEKVSSLEYEEHCSIVVDENMYAIVCGISENISLSDTESEGSDGSWTSDAKRSAMSTNPEEIRTKVKGEFQIGKCQFLMKEGKVEHENSDCIVNITQTEIEKGDIWFGLNKNVQDDLAVQCGIPQNRTNWTKTGSLITSVTGLPCKYILHVLEKGDAVKTVVRCLQLANTITDVNSVAFFSVPSRGKRDSAVKDSPQPVVEAINKYQKSSKTNLTSVQLVLGKVKHTFVEIVQDEVLKWKNQGRGFFSWPWKDTRGNTKSETPNRADTKAAAPLPPLPPPVVKEELEELIKADVTVYVCSSNPQTNQRVFEKLCAFWEHKLSLPRVIVDDRIKKLNAKEWYLSPPTSIQQNPTKIVDVDFDRDIGRLEIRGFSADIDNAVTKLSRLLDDIEAPGPTSSLHHKNNGITIADAFPSDFEVMRNLKGTEMKLPRSIDFPDSSKPDDDDDIFGKFVASELRDIVDKKEKRKVKQNIKRLLLDAVSKELV